MDASIPQIPSAFVHHTDIKLVLGATMDEFMHDEKEAIFFFYALGAAVQDISLVTHLTPGHVTSALNLYAARMESKLRFFKKFIPHNDDESLSAGEYLFMDALV